MPARLGRSPDRAALRASGIGDCANPNDPSGSGFDPPEGSAYLPAMAIRPLVKLPDPKLRLVSEPIGDVTDEIRTLAADMLDTMYDAPGIGLAAIQIGVPLRLVVIDLGKTEEERRPVVLVNPEVVQASDETRVHEEGCLSIPEYYEEVERPDRVTVRYRDLDGRDVEADAEGVFATCIQHEIDHLNGVLFIDHLSRLKRQRVIKKFEKAARRESEDA
jgi:peptide deformylase